MKHIIPAAPESAIWKRLVRNPDKNKYFSCIFNINGYQRFTNTKDLCAETPTIYINNATVELLPLQ